MIKLSHLNRIKQSTYFTHFYLILQASIANSADDIWKNNENQTDQLQTNEKQQYKVRYLSEDSGKIELKISEEKIEKF